MISYIIMVKSSLYRYLRQNILVNANLFFAIKHQFSSVITSIKWRNSILIATWSRTLFSFCVNTHASCVSIDQQQPIWFIGVIQVYNITTFKKLEAKKYENRKKNVLYCYLSHLTHLTINFCPRWKLYVIRRIMIHLT